MSFRCIKAQMLAFSGRFSRKCLEGISFNFLYILSSIDQQEVRQRKNTSISNVIPELKYNPSLLRISCQCLICCLQLKNEFGGGFDVNHVHRIATTSGVVQYPINLERVHLNCKAKISGGQRQEDAKLLTLITCMLSKLYKVLWGDFYILLLQKLSLFLTVQDSSIGDLLTH